VSGVLCGIGFSLWGFGLARTEFHRLNRLRKKYLFCHSERSEKSLFDCAQEKKERFFASLRMTKVGVLSLFGARASNRDHSVSAARRVSAALFQDVNQTKRLLQPAA
jgi:hypothetical protein